MGGLFEYADLDDERLVGLARNGQPVAARNELVLRYLAAASDLVARRATHWGFSRNEIDDGTQEAVFWIIEAIDHYDVEHRDQRNGCSFRSFLNRVLNARLTDLARRSGRLRSHFRCWCDLPEDVAEGAFRAAAIGRNVSTYGRPPDGPVASAQRRESARRLQRAVAQLDDSRRRLWGRLVRGEKLRTIAVALGMSYDSVKRRRRTLLRLLSIGLKE